MTADELLSIEPQELQFPFELKKQISRSLQLRNKSDNYVAFKVKTTNPKKYCVRPNTGVVLPRLSCDVIVTMQAQKEMPLDMQCKDKFLLQSVITSPGATAKDITPEMFNKEAGHVVEECKLRVVYVAPPGPPSPVREESEEGSSPRASVSDNGSFSTSEQSAVSRSYVQRPQSEYNSPEAKALISKLTEEKNSAVQQNKLLQKELEQLRHHSSRSRGGIPFIYTILVAMVGIILGYLMKRT
ncbi:PREDICTED: vesicle-associated protein 1-2 [Populus euphratica]|uniref:Vesicle-associated protein 1-2 n=1 Tax=Populus euphratica TaxID=75702 RepID=A0AAJ6UPN2_POPEU|nr:PREDICTED: vesicle-associated protein 1-2 [Populus euphratica]